MGRMGASPFLHQPRRFRNGQHQPRDPGREPDARPRAAAHAERHVRLQAPASPSTRARRTRPPASGARSPTTSTSPSGATRARAARASSRRGGPWRSTAGSTGASGRRRTGRSGRRSRSSPTTCSSSAAATAAARAAASGSSCRRAPPTTPPTSVRRRRRHSVLERFEWRRRSAARARGGRQAHRSASGTASSARTRSTRSTTRTSTSCGGTSPRRGRSAQDGSPARAAGIRDRCRSRSSARARWRCCRTCRTVMEVILLSDVDKVGLKGDVVNVARGYARNYLVPRRLAEEATPARVAELQKRESQRARQEAQTFDQARELADVLASTVLRFDVKAGPTGSLFGSVTPTDIVEELWTLKKVRVDRRKVGTDPIKRIGRYRCRSSSFQDVTVEVQTHVASRGRRAAARRGARGDGGGERAEQEAAAEASAVLEPELEDEVAEDEVTGSGRGGGARRGRAAPARRRRRRVTASSTNNPSTGARAPVEFARKFAHGAGKASTAPSGGAAILRLLSPANRAKSTCRKHPRPDLATAERACLTRPTWLSSPRSRPPPRSRLKISKQRSRSSAR